MRNEIDIFLNMMTETIPSDIISYIIGTYIYKPVNMYTIKKQRILKKIANKELNKFFGILHYDRNFIVYQNNEGQVILENNYVVPNIELYSQQNTSNNLIQSNHDTNVIVLFNNINNQILDENGILRQKRIHLSIMYI